MTEWTDLQIIISRIKINKQLRGHPSKTGVEPMWTTSDGRGGSAINRFNCPQPDVCEWESVSESDTSPPSSSTGIRIAVYLRFGRFLTFLAKVFARTSLMDAVLWNVSHVHTLSSTLVSVGPNKWISQCGLNKWTICYYNYQRQARCHVRDLHSPVRWIVKFSKHLTLSIHHRTGWCVYLCPA